MNSFYKTYFQATIMGLCVIMLFSFIMWRWDHTEYPGCKITHQIGNILAITLDEDRFDGSDADCLQAGKLILSICEDGYQVLCWGRVIHLEEAKQLASGELLYGS